MYRYKIPNSKKVKLYDFYVLSFLIDKIKTLEEFPVGSLVASGMVIPTDTARLGLKEGFADMVNPLITP